jgi:hypothetical protein
MITLILVVTHDRHNKKRKRLIKENERSVRLNVCSMAEALMDGYLSIADKKRE